MIIRDWGWSCDATWSLTLFNISGLVCELKDYNSTETCIIREYGDVDSMDAAVEAHFYEKMRNK